jgi:anti-anti-sigma factor
MQNSGESVALQGRINVETAVEMRMALSQALRAKPAELPVDLSGVSYIDFSGMATLVEALRTANKQGTRLILSGLHDQPRYLLEVTHTLRTMAVDPIEFVVTPKYVAAMIAIPCLTIMSSAFGLLAGAALMYISTKITLGMYLRYISESIVLRDVITGLIKSLVFAAIIVNVGCMEGFRTRGGPDAVGRSATSAVVRSTFLVILADAFFTAIFYLLKKD